MSNQLKRKNEDDTLDSNIQAKLNKLEEAQRDQVFEELNERTLKKLVLTFEKVYSTNQDMRSKYPDNPEKFMDSEIQLDDEIKKLQIIATAPELYPLFVKLGTITSLGSLLDHENNDMVIDVIDLFKELVEQESPHNDEQLTLTSSLIENSILETLVHVLEKFNAKEYDDQQAIHNILSIFESSLEMKPLEASTVLIEKSNICNYIMEAIKPKSPFTIPLKLYCCEILSILLQQNENGRRKFGQMDGIEKILVIVSAYKKKSPEAMEEKEMVENLFSALCSCLFDDFNRKMFLKSQGIDLMLLFIKNKTTLRSSALKVLDFALLRNKANSEQFIDSLGLKTLFSSLMKKIKSKHTKSKIYNEVEDDEHIITILHSLFTNLEKNTERYNRLVSKFTENNFEKIDKWLQLYEKYSKVVKHADDGIRQNIKEGLLDPEEDEDEIFFRRLDAGLFKLQYISLILAILFNQDKEIKETILLKLKERNINIKEIIYILQEYNENSGSSVGNENEKVELHKKLTDLLDGLIQQSKKE